MGDRTENQTETPSQEERKIAQAATVHASEVDKTAQLPTEPPKPEPAKQEALPVLPTNLRYEGMEEFARGGLGRIVRATDKRLNRPVAMKELLHTRGSAEARFLREAYLTARLEHPSIIPVHDAGRWPSGAPFFSMKLVAGKSLKEVLDDTTTLPERLALLPHLLDTAEAIAYAHSKRIIHRDIKPHNILVGEFGETVVIDWGIAKEMGSEDPTDPDSGVTTLTKDVESSNQNLTRLGAVIGTPAYMSPEQAAGKPVDERADVYSLGAILYYILVGAPPYTGASSSDVLRQVIATAPKEILALQPEAPRDLVAICYKAMARELEQRYRTAKELAKDLRDYQLGGLVGAHHYTISELVSRWIKKNTLTVTVAGVLLFLMLVGGVVAVVSILGAKTTAENALAMEATQRQEADKQSAIARERQQQAEESSNQLRLLQARDALDKDPAATLAWLKGLSPGASGWSYARLLAQETQRRGAATNVFRGHTALVDYMAFSPDGRQLVSASKDGTLRLWDVDAKTSIVLQVSAKDQRPSEILAAAFSADGAWLAASDNSGAVRLWRVADVRADLLDGKLIEGHSDAVTAIAFSPDLKKMVTASKDTLLLSYDLASGARAPIGSQRSPVASITFSADSDSLASAGQDGAVLLWSLSKRTATSLVGAVLPSVPVRFLASGAKLLGAADGGVLIWSMSAPSEPPVTLSISEESPTHMEVSQGGEWLALSGQSGLVRLWSLATFERHTLRGDDSPIEALRFSPDGATLAVASSDKTVWLWDTKSGTGHALKGHLGRVKSLAFSSDSKTLASVCDYNAVRFWDTSSGADLGASLWLGHRATVTDIAASSDDSMVFSVDEAGELWQHNAKTGEGSLLTKASGPLFAVALSPDQRYIAFAGAEVWLWERASGKSERLKGHSDTVRALAFSPDGKTLASGSADATLLFWDLTTKVATNKGWFEGGVNDLAFSPDGRLLAIAAADRMTHFLELSSGAPFQIQAHMDSVTAVSFSSDGRWFASGSLDKGVRVFDVKGLRDEGAKPLYSLDGHTGRVNQLSFSADGEQLLSTSDDHSTRLWDLSSAQSVIVQNALTQGRAAIYMQKTDRIIASDERSALIVWQNVKLPKEPSLFIEWLSRATSANVGKDYKLRSNK